MGPLYSELPVAEARFHISQGRPPEGYYCLRPRKGDRHSPGYLRAYMREYMRAYRKRRTVNRTENR